MSAIRTPKHSTKKRIVVNLKTGQTVNVAKIWAVSHRCPGNYWGKYYTLEAAAQALEHLSWAGVFVDRVKLDHILDDEGSTHNDWIEATDPASPHETMREWNQLLSQL